MRKRHLTVNLLAAAALVMATADASGQTTNPRFGVWKMQSDAPPPSINIMTYESYGDGGMRITVESTNSPLATTIRASRASICAGVHEIMPQL